MTTARTIKVQHNSLGLRDIELRAVAQPRIMFIGDLFVWGVDAQANERFTDLLRDRIAGHGIVNAGVSGYGTDQQYLLLRRLWPGIEPAVVVLIFCSINDRADNSTNASYGGYRKPYFATAPDGSLTLQGQPVPISRQLYIKQNWLVRHSWVARVLVSAYVEIRHPRVNVPDPTERLVDMIRDFVRIARREIAGRPGRQRSVADPASAVGEDPLRGVRRRRELRPGAWRTLDAGRQQVRRRAACSTC